MNIIRTALDFGIKIDAWVQVVRDIGHFMLCTCKIGWRLRRAFAALALFGLILGVDQANEYFDNILYACIGQADDCPSPLGIRVTLIQGAVLTASIIWFAYLVRDTALFALRSSSAWDAARSKYLIVFATWLGAVPLLLFSHRALTSTGYGNQLVVFPVLIGIFLLASIVQAALASAPRVSRLAAGSLFAVAVTAMSFGSFHAEWDTAVFFAAWLLFTAVLVFAALKGGCPRTYYWWIIGISASIAFALALQLLTIGVSLMYRTHRLGVAIACLLPLVLLLIPARIPKSAQIHVYADEPRQARLWRHFRGLPPHMPPLYLSALVVSVVVLFIAGDKPLVFADYMIAPATLILVLATAGVCYVLAMSVLGRPVFWCGAIVLAMVSWSNIAPPAPLAAPEKAFVKGDCRNAVAFCSMDERIWERYQRWAAKPGRRKDDPIILVAAAGGGSRAAAHTATSLAAVDAATCGAFGDQIFAISGVSGGAIGSLLYAASRVDAYNPVQRALCRNTKPDERALPLVNSLLTAASADHLSPVVLRGATHDLIRSAVNLARIDGSASQSDFSTRSGVLTMSWYYRYEVFLKANKLKIENNALAQEDRLRNDAQPLLVSNATSVQDGHRVLLSFPLLCPRDGWCGEHMSPLSDALDSARFPLVSPAHARNVYHWNPWLKKEAVSERAIVDGGYFDNSGGQTILDIANVLEQHGIPRSRMFALLISSDPDEGFEAKTVPDYTVSGGLTQLAVPVHSLVAVRDGRTAISLNDMQQRLGECQVIHWSMSSRSLNPETAESSAGTQPDPASDAAKELHQGKEQDLEANLRRLKRSPALGWALSERSANGLLGLAYGHGMSFGEASFRYKNEMLLASRLRYNSAVDQQRLANGMKNNDCMAMK
ncbi:hypothetical protein [Massilia phyllosphaerae]|uniref:hypothetical protein n=1 Tax=Massilia phyllosphaerae TaxID=3106034 RepID=UPI002B1CC22A|nr:hypothetical protein [Massilia sp. SGZ-792]